MPTYRISVRTMTFLGISLGQIVDSFHAFGLDECLQKPFNQLSRQAQWGCTRPAKKFPLRANKFFAAPAPPHFFCNDFRLNQGRGKQKRPQDAGVRGLGTVTIRPGRRPCRSPGQWSWLLAAKPAAFSTSMTSRMWSGPRVCKTKSTSTLRTGNDVKARW